MSPSLKKNTKKKCQAKSHLSGTSSRSTVDPVPEDMVELVRTTGTRNRGGGIGGEAWVIRVGEKRAGIVFINIIEDSQRGRHASLQIFLNRASQGRHIGRVAYRAACLASQYSEIYAHMRKSNTASRKAAIYAGFQDATTTDDAQLVMLWLRPRTNEILDDKQPPLTNKSNSTIRRG